MVHRAARCGQSPSGPPRSHGPWSLALPSWAWPENTYTAHSACADLGGHQLVRLNPKAVERVPKSGCAAASVLPRYTLLHDSAVGPHKLSDYTQTLQKPASRDRGGDRKVKRPATELQNRKRAYVFCPSSICHDPEMRRQRHMVMNELPGSNPHTGSGPAGPFSLCGRHLTDDRSIFNNWKPDVKEQTKRARSLFPSFLWGPNLQSLCLIRDIGLGVGKPDSQAGAGRASPQLALRPPPSVRPSPAPRTRGDTGARPRAIPSANSCQGSGRPRWPRER